MSRSSTKQSNIPYMDYAKIRPVKSPARANQHDAGVDFFVPDDFQTTIVPPFGDIKIPSGIKVNIPEGTALIAHNKSGVATKKRLVHGACVIDCGYQGEIVMHLINTTDQPVEVKAGEKILQFVHVPVLLDTWEEMMEPLLYVEKSNRGEGGFGSTGHH